MKRHIWLTSLIVICLGIHIFSRDPFWVENAYFHPFFVPFSLFLRRFLGSWPISLGDIFYACILFGLLISGIILTYKLIINSGKNRGKLIKSTAYVTLTVFLWVYLVFNIFWGINYNRPGVARQLSLDVRKIEKIDLAGLNEWLVMKVNSCKWKSDSMAVPDRNLIFEKTRHAYALLAETHPFLRYDTASIKPTYYSGFLNYAGFTGYYNPFTGEAQVNTSIPEFLQPFTVCHEVAHQLGYAKEMEANFVGFLAASGSDDPYFNYSAYLEVFLYANNDLWKQDSVAAKGFREQLSFPVTQDLALWKEFRKKHETPWSAVAEFVYDAFLRSNQQPYGMGSYARVTLLLDAYCKKYGRN